jgi:hypothetical protein
MDALELPSRILFIYPSYIGFGLPVLLLLYFSFTTRDYLTVRQRFKWCFALYVVNQLIGSSFFNLGLVSLKDGYYLAGLPLPLLLCFLARWYIRKIGPKQNNPSDIDHFIQH